MTIVVLGVVLIPLAYLPTLVVQESLPWPAYQTQVALSALITSTSASALWRSG